MSSVSPRRPRPSPPGESLVVASFGGILAFVGALCFLIWWEYGYSLLLAVPVAAVVSLSLLVARLKQRDYETYLAMFPPEPEPEPLPEPDPILRPVAVATNGLGQVLTYSRFDLPLSDWQRLARVFLKDEKITRRIVAAAGVKHKSFEGLTEAYPSIRDKMGPLPNGAGWFDASGKLTDSGRVHFEQFVDLAQVINTPSPTLPAPFVTAALHETTTTTTGQNGVRGVS